MVAAKLGFKETMVGAPGGQILTLAA